MLIFLLIDRIKAFVKYYTCQDSIRQEKRENKFNIYVKMIL